MNAALREIPLSRITLSPSEPQQQRRKRFDEAALAELAESVRAHGILQPIIVRPDAKDYELVAGERRYRAAQQAGLEQIPCVVRGLSDEAVLEVQLIENLQRADLHPMEEAEGYQQLMKTHGHPIEELHERVGKSRSYVYGRVKLLALCEAARSAFYDGTISASVALLLARIPVEKLQKEALKAITDGRRFGRGPMSFREAREYVHETYMLRLSEASFPTDDERLVRKAGACNACPKRTGNQPELFGEIKSADVCTDPVCFSKKVRAHGNRLIKQAEAEGRPTITGGQAKHLAPNGTNWRRIPGYSKLDDVDYRDPKRRKVKQLVGKRAERTLLQDPQTGAVIELVKDSIVDEAVREKGGTRTTPAADDGTRARRKKAKQERAFRVALYEELRPLLSFPDYRDIAEAMFERLEHEMIKELCRVRGFEPPKKTGYPGGPAYRDHRAIRKTIPDMTGAELPGFINDMIYVRELQVPSWSNAKPERLLAAAQVNGIDAAAVRKRVATKKKARKKAAKKKAATA